MTFRLIKYPKYQICFIFTPVKEKGPDTNNSNPMTLKRKIELRFLQAPFARYPRYIKRNATPFLLDGKYIYVP